MATRKTHEWNEDKCRNCGLKAVTPQDKLYADLLVKCTWPNDYNDETLWQAIETAHISGEVGKDQIAWVKALKRPDSMTLHILDVKIFKTPEEYERHKDEKNS